MPTRAGSVTRGRQPVVKVMTASTWLRASRVPEQKAQAANGIAGEESLKRWTASAGGQTARCERPCVCFVRRSGLLPVCCSQRYVPFWVSVTVSAVVTGSLVPCGHHQG